MAGPIANLTVKLSAQIAEFQSEFKQAEKSADKFRQNFEATAIKASALGNIIAAGAIAAVGGLRRLGESILDNASNITDLSNKTGLAMSTIQEFQHVAEQTGTTVDAFTNAAFKLGTNLAGGSKSVVAAISALGLSFETIRNLRPDDQFDQIASALSRMENPQERNRIGLELYGRAFKDIAPAIAEGYRKMADEATKSSDAQIRALDAAGDAWAKFSRAVVTHATSAVGSAVIAAQAIKDSFANIVSRFAAQGPAGGIQQVIAEVADSFYEVELAAISANKPNKELVQTFLDQADSTDKAANASKRHASALREQESEARRLASIRESFTGEDQVRAAQDLFRAFNQVIPLQRLSAEQHERINTLLGEAIEVTERLGKTAPQAWKDVYAATFNYANLVPLLPPPILGIADAIGEIGIQSSMAIPQATAQLEGLNLTVAEGQRLLEGYLEVVAVAPSLFKRMFGSWKDIGLNLTANLANALNFSGGGIANSLKNFADTTAKQFAQTALSFIPGIGPLISQFAGPIIDGLKKAFSSIFDRNRGRDIIEDFASSFGGFDALHRELQGLFDDASAERFWIMLTQGVGRNNPDQARRAIETVTAAIDEQRRKQNDNAQAAVDASQKIREAQDSITAGLKSKASELQSQYDTLWQSIKDEMPEEITEDNPRGMGIEEARIRDRMAVIKQEQEAAQQKLDEHLQATATTFTEIITTGLQDAAVKFGDTFNSILDRGSRSPGAGVSVGSTSGMAGPTSQRIGIYLDGAVIAEKTVPYMPGELSLNGI